MDHVDGVSSRARLAFFSALLCTTRLAQGLGWLSQPLATLAKTVSCLFTADMVINLVCMQEEQIRAFLFSLFLWRLQRREKRDSRDWSQK